jgi:hypothetical protein
MTDTAEVDMLPGFPEFRPIELADREIIEPVLQHAQPVISELTFANLFLWRNVYQFSLSSASGGLAIRAIDRLGEPFFLPLVGVTDEELIVKEMRLKVCRAPEYLARKLESLGFRIELDRDNSDYVYLADDLINLPGRKFHRKRNQIAQFEASTSYEYRRVTPELVAECVKLQETWCDIRDCFIPGNRSLAEENAAVIEALTLLDELKLSAGAILVDGEVVAFSIGGRLNNETLVIHFEKACPAYPGLYQVINREFCADVALGYKFVNREQDLGEPGLRKAKESYFPHHMVFKYAVYPPH